MLYDLSIELSGVLAVRLTLTGISKVVTGVALSTAPLSATVTAYAYRDVVLTLFQLIPIVAIVGIAWRIIITHCGGLKTFVCTQLLELRVK